MAMVGSAVLWNVGFGVLHAIRARVLLTADLGWLLVVLTQPSVRHQAPLLLVSNVWVHRGGRVLSVLSQVQTARPPRLLSSRAGLSKYSGTHFSTWNPETIP